MTEENKTLWNKLSKPPKDALKAIGGGRLKGMTDVNPQWRYEALTDACGPCGVGWKYTIEKMWTEPGPSDTVFAFVLVNLFVKNNDTWGEPIPGIGGSMLVELEKNGLHGSDEAFKMATTDALSVAMKMVGVASEVYRGRWDGSKYRDAPKQENEPQTTKDQLRDQAANEYAAELCAQIDLCTTMEKLVSWRKANSDKVNALAPIHKAKVSNYWLEIEKILKENDVPV